MVIVFFNYIRFTELFLNNLYSYAYQDIKKITSDIVYYNTLVKSISDIKITNNIILSYFYDYFSNNNINFEEYKEFLQMEFLKIHKDLLKKIIDLGFYLEREFYDRRIVFHNYIKTNDSIIYLKFSIPLNKYAPFVYANSNNIDDIGLILNGESETITLTLTQKSLELKDAKRFKFGLDISKYQKIYIGLDSVLYIRTFESIKEWGEAVNNLKTVSYIYDKTIIPMFTIFLIFFSIIISYVFLRLEMNRITKSMVESITTPLEKLNESIRDFSKSYYINSQDTERIEVNEIKNIVETFQEVSEIIAAHVEELYATNQELEKTYNELNKYVEKAENAYFYFVAQLAQIAEGYDEVTGNHIDRVGALAEFIAKKIGLNEEMIVKIYKFAPLHDVGKILIPKKILMKQGPLTSEEFEIMKLHTIIGAAIIGEDSYFESARYISLYHHEKYDGTGYPFGLKGDDIPIEAQIVGLVDIYDALRSERPYKRGFTHLEALEIITKGDKRISPSAFNPKLLNVFIENQASINAIWDNLNSYSKSSKKNALFESIGTFLEKIQKYDLEN